MHFRNLISTPFPLLATPETQYRTYLVPRPSSRSFPPILLQFRLRADHRRLRMSTGGFSVFRQLAYTLRTTLVVQLPIFVSTICAWQPFLVPRIPTAKSALYLSLVSQFRRYPILIICVTRSGHLNVKVEGTRNCRFKGLEDHSTRPIFPLVVQPLFPQIRVVSPQFRKTFEEHRH
jgi:hypothetical protein